MLVNCILAGNTADLHGGGMHNQNSSPAVVNCTFSSNQAGVGGGMMNNQSSPTVTNCILWGNTPDEIYESSGDSVVNYSDVQGGWPGIGNINDDPAFIDFEGPDTVPGTPDDDLRL